VHLHFVDLLCTVYYAILYIILYSVLCVHCVLVTGRWTFKAAIHKILAGNIIQLAQCFLSSSLLLMKDLIASSRYSCIVSSVALYFIAFYCLCIIFNLL